MSQAATIKINKSSKKPSKIFKFKFQCKENDDDNSD